MKFHPDEASERREEARFMVTLRIEIASLKQTVAELRAERERLVTALGFADDWISKTPHGDNCHLHDTGEFAQCLCGKTNVRDELALASPPAAEEPSTKGRYGAECNRASCHNVPATWKHRDIPRHYCQPCGMWINENNSDCDPPLCGPVAGDAT